MDEQTLGLLIEQLQTLKEILSALQSPPTLGLLDNVPGTLFIYCNRDRCPGALWYTLDSDSHPVELPAKAIRGYITDLRFEEVERRGKKTHKLYLTLDCGDQSARLECGHTSVFAKGILSAIASLDPEQLSMPIAIAPAPGSDESVLLANLFQGNERIFAAWDEQTDWRQIAAQAIANVRSLHPAV
jgi:hypothetical protein